MVTVVVVFNVLIALLCLYVAWRVWKLQKVLASAANALIVAEQRTHAVLANAPQGIEGKQLTAQQLRRQYRQLELQLEQAQQALALTGLSQLVWQWYKRRKTVRQSRRGLPSVVRR